MTNLKEFDCIKFDEKYIDGVARKKATNLISNNIEKIVSPLNQSCVHLLTVYETK